MEDVGSCGVQGFRSSGVRKVLREGQLLIEKAGEKYDLLGRKVVQ